MRLAQYLARCGVASRRKAEEIILAGRVRVNGTVATDLGRQVVPGQDSVQLDGRPIMLAASHLTLALHKPVHVVTTRSDPQNRQTIYDLLKPPFSTRSRELVYAGRLDFETSGLLILTTDGELVNRLTHPRHHVAKVYRLEMVCSLSAAQLQRLREGVLLDDGMTQPTTVQVVGPRTYQLLLREGRNRQIRRMVDAVGADLVSLHREAIGALRLEDLSIPPGEAVELTPEQVDALFQNPELKSRGA